MTTRVAERQHLLIDADDTLWENNIYFEDAFDEFIRFLDHSRLTGPEVRAILDEIEMANNRVRGYGSLNFGRNMQECYQHLAEREISEDDLRTVMSFAERILERPMELLPGVAETLAELSTRHDLILFTKGHPEEQRLKVDRSGLGRHFIHTAIAKEKDPDSYRQLVREQGIDVQRGWMIGNSPKSDINPALEIGLRAVYVPHERTWHLEKTELAEAPGRLLVVERFSDLVQYF